MIVGIICLAYAIALLWLYGSSDPDDWLAL